MPIYEYKCQDCGEITEILQKFSDKPLSQCPSCGGKVAKIISNCTFQLKGSGWYVTDYKNKERGRDKESESKKDEEKKDKFKKDEDKKD